MNATDCSVVHESHKHHKGDTASYCHVTHDFLFEAVESVIGAKNRKTTAAGKAIGIIMILAVCVAGSFTIRNM